MLFAADGTRLPFDVAPLRSLPYQLGADGRPSAPAVDRANLAKLLDQAKADAIDSPVYQLVEGFPDIQHIKTDVFRERVEYAATIKQDLATARKKKEGAVDAIRAIEQKVGAFDRVEAGVLVDLLLSYRDVSAWADMTRVARAFPEPLRRTPLVQEQLAFALNRSGQGEEAERVLVDLL